MRCSGCGKDVPFAGEVCPHCLRDKRSDQQGAVAGTIAFITGAVIGNAIAGFGGMAVGALGLGFIVAIIMAGSKGHSAKKPPRVRVEPSSIPSTGRGERSPSAAAAYDTGTRLQRLDKLKADGLVAAAEYDDQRRAIIQAI